jgi:hypothetical protein
MARAEATTANEKCRVEAVNIFIGREDIKKLYD